MADSQQARYPPSVPESSANQRERSKCPYWNSATLGAIAFAPTLVARPRTIFRFVHIVLHFLFTPPCPPPRCPRGKDKPLRSGSTSVQTQVKTDSRGNQKFVSKRNSSPAPAPPAPTYNPLDPASSKRRKIEQDLPDDGCSPEDLYHPPLQEVGGDAALAQSKKYGKVNQNLWGICIAL